MAATGFTPIQLYRTTTASAQPSAGNLADGELAINLTDKKLYAKDASNNVFVLADASSGGTTATNLAGGAAGSVPYQTGANATTFLGIGTAAQVLQVNSGATAPEWVSSSGTGNVARTTSPSFTTPSLGAATALSINSLTLTTSTGTFTLANGKTLTVNNSLTLSGTDATTMTFPSTSATIARTDAAQTFTGTQTVQAAATQDAVALAGRAGGTSSFVSTLTPTTLSASRTVTLPDADTTVPVATQVLTFTGPTAGRTITLPDANFTVARSDAAQSFTGTQTFLSNPVLDAGTANGVLYLSASKVVTSGSALTFDGTTLSALTSGTSVYFSGGDSSVGRRLQLYATSTTNTGDTQNISALGATGVLAFALNSSEQMRLTSTGLGIGTSSPQVKLEVSDSSAGAVSARITNTANVSQYLSIQMSGGTAFGVPGWDNSGVIEAVADGVGSGTRALYLSAYNGPLIFATGSGSRNERMRLDSSGNLGLGVTPSAWGGSGVRAFDVGTAAAFSGSGSDVGMIANAYYNGSNWIYKTSSLAVRYQQIIGTGVHAWYTAPSGTAGDPISFTQAMDLANSGGASTLTVNSALNTASAVRLTTAGGLSAGMFLANPTVDHSLGFQTSGTEKARITSGGDLLVGTTSSTETSGVGHKINTSLSAPWLATVGSVSTDANVSYSLYSTGAGAYRFYVGYGGTIYATSTSISAISDATLKENVRDLETGLTEVMALKPRRFDWKNGDAQNVAGFVAQEVEQVLPELVTDYQYSDTETKKSLKMGDILPTLVKAIQEQQAFITTLTARLAAAGI